MLPEKLSTDLTSLGRPAGAPGDRDRVRRGARTARSRRRMSTAPSSATGRSWRTTPSAPGSPARDRFRRPPPPCRAWTSSCGSRIAWRRRSNAQRDAAGRARIRNDRGRDGVRRRHAARRPSAGAEPGEVAHRQPDDRRQRRRRAISGRAWLSVAAPRGEVAGTVGSHPDARGRTRGTCCRRTPTRWRWRRFWPIASRPIPRRFPICRRSVIRLLGRGEYVVDPPGRGTAGTFRPGRARLLAFDGAEPAISGSRDAAADQGVAGKPCLALLDRRAGADRHALHPAGGRGEQGRTPGAQVGRGDGRGVARGRDVRRDRHRRIEQGDVRARGVSRRSKES